MKVNSGQESAKVTRRNSRPHGLNAQVQCYEVSLPGTCLVLHEHLHTPFWGYRGSKVSLTWLTEGPPCPIGTHMSSATVQSLTCRDTDCGVLWEDRASTVSVNYLPLLLNTESHEIEPGSVPNIPKGPAVARCHVEPSARARGLPRRFPCGEPRY